ncbi:homocysteine S-methyltransferase YbgG-like [Ornithodoros turicata]|uniref:homocysteine S-methyltransferase YbgG-like n=1 Tax=Ornithodoros turicata TaxID=34597 RepID=UPI003138C9EA
MERQVDILNGSLNSQLKYQVDGDPLGTTRVVMQDPEAIVKAYQGYIGVGCSILTTCTFQGSTQAIQEDLGVSVDEAEHTIGRSVSLVREAIQRSAHEDQLNRNNPRTSRILVAGSVGCYGAYLYDGSEFHGRYAETMSVEELRDWHRPRVKCLVGAGCDVLAFETIPVQKEALALLQLLREFPNTRAWLSFSCQDERDIANQEPFAQAVATCMARDSNCQLVAIGINCCKPELVLPLLKSASDSAPLRVPMVAYPDNSELYSKADGKSADPFGEYIKDWYRVGVRIMGGCCMVKPSDIAPMADVMASLSVQQSDSVG